MLSYEQLIHEVVSIRNSSDQLSQMIASASLDLRTNAQSIGAIVRGSATGEQAVLAVNAAARSLADASVSMKTLSRICDDCADNLAR